MQFRPCIDIHQGRVKQIVGETLNTASGNVVENFVSAYNSAYYAEMFQRDDLYGGHVIMLGPGNEEAALQALQAFPGGLQVGGGINADNASRYLEAGASHVIVTSYIFRDGQLVRDNLERIVAAVGKARLVIDLSCRRKDDGWYVVTNQWKTFSDFKLNREGLEELAGYCDEFLIHAVDVEGKRTGILEDLVRDLADWAPIPVTYAGGVRNREDLETFHRLTGGKLHVTVGSALDIFGGSLPYREVVEYCRNAGK